MASNIYKYILKENVYARQNFGVARPTELLPPAAAAACPVQLRKEEAGSAPWLEKQTNKSCLSFLQEAFSMENIGQVRFFRVGPVRKSLHYQV